MPIIVFDSEGVMSSELVTSATTVNFKYNKDVVERLWNDVREMRPG